MRGRHPRGRKIARPPEASHDEPLTQIVVLPNPRDRIGNAGRGSRIAVLSRITTDFGQARRIRDDRWTTGRHRLDYRHPESFEQRREDQHAGLPIQIRQLGAGHVSEIYHLVAEPKSVDLFVDDMEVNAGKDQFRNYLLLLEEDESTEQSFMILVRPIVGWIKQERFGSRHRYWGRRLARL